MTEAGAALCIFEKTNIAQTWALHYSGVSITFGIKSYFCHLLAFKVGQIFIRRPCVFLPQIAGLALPGGSDFHCTTVL